MDLVAIGIGVLGLSMCLLAAEVFPTIRVWWRRRKVLTPRSGPRAKTIIMIKEETKNGECGSIEAND